MVYDTLKRTKDIVWPEIKKYLKDPAYPKQFSIAGKFPREIELYWKINKTYPLRKGKYIRPTLVLLTASAMGADINSAIKTAAAMQLSEEWILIHDDIEDKSEERRNAPTLQRIYGDELAINAGDALHIVMWKIINDINSKTISDEFYRMLLRTAMGQGIEQIWINKKPKPNKERYFFVADSKTGYYSIGGPLRLGGMIAKAKQSQLNLLTEFGLHLGRCFNIVDDILDIEQDEKEGKLTLVRFRGVDFAKKIATEEKNIARDIFENKLGFLKKEPARTQLSELIDFILERDY